MDLQKQLLEKHGKHLVCNDDTEIVIEGYPRSGNSFTCEMVFLLTQDHGIMRIGHHTHDIRNLRLGAQLGKPLVVLIRHPAQAILSSMVFDNTGAQAASERYRNFYRDVLTLEHIHIVPFEAIITDLPAVFELVLKLTERQVPMPEDWEAVTKQAKSGEKERAKRIHGDAYERRVAVPNAEREKIKAEKRPEVEHYLATTELGAEINDIYQQCLGRTVIPLPAT